MQRLFKKCILLILPLLVLISSCTTNKPNQWKEAYWEYFWKKNSTDILKTESRYTPDITPPVKFADMNYDGVPEMFLGYEVFTCANGKVQQFSSPQFVYGTNDFDIYENNDKTMRCIFTELSNSTQRSLYRYDFDFKTLTILVSEWLEIDFFTPSPFSQEKIVVFISSDGEKQYLNDDAQEKEDKNRQDNWHNLNIEQNYFNGETKAQAKERFYALMNNAV